MPHYKEVQRLSLLGLGPPGTPPKSLKAFDKADAPVSSSCKPGDSGHHGSQSSQCWAEGDALRGKGVPGVDFGTGQNKSSSPEGYLGAQRRDLENVQAVSLSFLQICNKWFGL